MTVLPNLPLTYVRRIENLITDFIWNGKKAKIALKILQSDRSVGGLRLVDIRKKEISLKVQWVKILETDQKLSSLAYHFINPIINEDIWNCNLCKKDIESIFCNNNPFWKDVLHAWFSVHFNNLPLKKQSIWFNSNFRINGTVIFWTKNYKKGLMWIDQLLSGDKLIDRQEALEWYGLNFVELLSIYHAYISAKEPEVEDCEETCNTYENAVLRKDLTKYVYTKLCTIEGLLENKAISWMQDFEMYFDSDMLVQSIKNIYVTTNCSKYRSFQYRLLQRSVITNVHLHHWRKRETNLCTFCNNVKESYTHLFCTCPKVLEIWNLLTDFMLTYNKTPTSLEKSDIICNSIAEPRQNVKNFICLIAKQYIYRQRCFGHTLQIAELIALIQRVKNIEKYNAIRKGNLIYHVKKWENCQTPHLNLVKFEEMYVEQL